MFRLNQETTTITGETLTPYLVEGTSVYCWSRSGKTIAKKINDFSLEGPTVSETMVGGSSVIPITPIRGAKQVVQKQPPTEEVEVSRPTLTKETATVPTIKDIGIAVTVSPDETEDEKVTYVHVAPAIDNYLGDGEMQAGGVEVVPADEVENRTEFNPAIEDDDYI